MSGLIPAIPFVQLPPLVGKHQAFGPLFLASPSIPHRSRRFAGLLSKWSRGHATRSAAREIARKTAGQGSPIVITIFAISYMRARVDADFRVGREPAESFALVANDRNIARKSERVRRKLGRQLHGALTAAARRNCVLKRREDGG